MRGIKKSNCSHLHALFQAAGWNKKQSDEWLWDKYHVGSVWKMTQDQLEDALEFMSWFVDTHFGNRTVRDALDDVE